jgi:hypothetical protein
MCQQSVSVSPMSPFPTAAGCLPSINLRNEKEYAIDMDMKLFYTLAD